MAPMTYIIIACLGRPSHSRTPSMYPPGTRMTQLHSACYAEYVLAELKVANVCVWSSPQQSHVVHSLRHMPVMPEQPTSDLKRDQRKLSRPAVPVPSTQHPIQYTNIHSRA